MAMWNPWRGCHKCSDGCKFCYIHKGDAKRGVDTDKVVKTDNFFAPVEKCVSGARKGEYKMKSGQIVYLCFSSDFLLEDADCWRDDCWKMIKERGDLHFLFLTKRIERLSRCLPADWGEGYDNVTIGCTIENQAMADRRLTVFDSAPVKHKDIICQPLLEKIDIEKHLKGIELVVVGGESDYYARPLDFDWVLDVRRQCISKGVKFEFRQCGTNFIKEGKTYKLNVRELTAQARRANVDT